jgi:hypothetical protein
MEAFGLVRVKIETAYTRLTNHYFIPNWNIIGVYYSKKEKVKIILYDVCSSQRITGISFLGELLLWESVEEISTTKFYCNGEICNDLSEIIASFFCITTDEKEQVFRSIITDDRYEPEIYTLLLSKLNSVVVSESSESTYRKTTQGIRCETLETVYNELHDSFFLVLSQLHKEGYSIFRCEPRVYTMKDENKIVRNLKNHIQQRRGGSLAPITLHRNELDLGDRSFVLPIIISYSHKDNKGLELACKDFDVILAPGDSDLSFLDKKTLIQILKYIEYSGDQFSGLERQIIFELSERELR